MLVLPGRSAPVYSLTYSPDGRLLASCDNEIVKLWDVAAGKEIATISGGPYEDHWGEQRVARIASVQFSADGKFLGLGEHRGRVMMWDVTSRSRTQSQAIYPHERTRLTAIAFSVDGEHGAFAIEGIGFCFGTLKRGKLVTFEPIRCTPIYGLAFSPDSRLFAMAGGQWNGAGQVRLFWDRSVARFYRCEGHRGPVLSLAFTPDSKTLATGGADFTVRLWDVSTATEEAILPGHKDLVRCVAFSPDGRTLTSASWDGTIKLWDVAGRCERTSYSWHRGMIHAVAFAPDGMTGATGGHDGSIVIWDVDV
jgi:WD40 repeat protein